MSSKKFPHMVNLVLGDWSQDGHNLTHTVTITSNLDKKALMSAYKKGVKKLDLDVQNEVAEEYEDGSLSIEQWKKLEAAGMTLEQLFANEKWEFDEAKEALENKEDSFGVSYESFSRIWLFTVKQGNPEFEYEIEEGESPNINIGGYGLFSP
jgi:hypothetical protein